MTFAQPFKDYEILDRIGSGAMGTVFKARHKSLNRIVALKVLRPSLARDQRYVNRLSREARIVAAFNHPNIVAGYDLGQEGGYHFFVMELVEGKSMRELLSEWGSFSEAQVLDTAIKITSALDHAYKKGVIHRDIKPGNILIDAHNRVKLTDMGLAKGPADLTITREGATVGTPQYISPEQARDPQNADVRSDLYSLGTTLFHMCTGQPPFRAETIANVILKVINDRAPSACDVNPEVSEALSLVIRKLMAKDPGLRYQTPAELLEDLHRLQRDEHPDVNLRQLEALDQVGGKPRRLAPVVGVAGLVALVIAGALIWGGNGNSREPQIPDAHPQEDYRLDLRKALDLEEWPARFRALRSRELVANNWQDKILAQARTELERDLGSELSGFLARQDVWLRQWILNWGAGNRFFKVELPDKLSERFGLRPAELSANLRSSYDQQVTRLKAKVHAYESERDTAYLRRLDHYHQNLYRTSREYRERLHDDDFYGAERTLRQTLRGFHRDDPPRAEMPPQLRPKVDKREATVLTQELERIDAAEQRVAQELRSRADGVVDQVHELLWTDPNRPAPTTPNPREAKRRLADARKRLIAGFPPEYFRSESSPWPEVEYKLDATERDVKLASENYERELLRVALRDALSIAFVDGRAGDAAAYLEGRLFDVGEQELKQYIDLLRLAEKVHNRMLTRVLDRQGSHFKVERLPGRTEIPVVLRREHDGRRLVMKDRKGVVSLALVTLPLLEQLAGGADFRDQLTAAERAGLAVWYVLGGDYAKVPKLIEKGPRSEFLNRDLRDLAQQLRKDELGPQMVAMRLQETAHTALKAGNWQQARNIVDQIHRQHPAFYQSHHAEQERIKHEAGDGLARTGKLALLEAEAPPGAKVRMQGWQVSVDYPLGTMEMPLPEGWQQSGQEDGGVSFVRPKPTLASALESALIVKSLMAKEDSNRITVLISLSFPKEGVTPRLVLLRCHGLGVVLGLMRNGAVVAKGVKVGELKDPRKLRKQLQPGLADVADKKGNVRTIQPGARHRLKLVVRRKGRRMHGIVYLDEDPIPLIPTFEVSGTSHPALELAVIAMHPLTVYTVRFEGEAKR